MNTHFKNHLYFETRPESQEFALERCRVVLGMIASLRDRNDSIIDFSKKFYGLNEKGNLVSSPKEVEKYLSNLKMIRRLQSYFNFCKSRINNF